MAARHPPTFPCEECQREFHSLSALNDHYRGSPSDRHPNCPKCGLGFRNIAERDAHEANEHPQVRCAACNGEVIYEDRLQSHYAERSPPHSLCSICQQGFKDAAELLSHKSGAHPACSGCRINFKSQDDLDNHVKSCSSTVEALMPIYATSGSTQSDLATETVHSLRGSTWRTSPPVVQIDSHGQEPLRPDTGTAKPPLHWTQWSSSIDLHGQRCSTVTSSTQPISGLATSSGLSNARVPSNPLPRHSPLWQTTPNHNLTNSFQSLSMTSMKSQQNQKTQSFTPFDQYGAEGHPRGRFLGNGTL